MREISADASGETARPWLKRIMHPRLTQFGSTPSASGSKESLSTFSGANVVRPRCADDTNAPQNIPSRLYTNPCDCVKPFGQKRAKSATSAISSPSNARMRPVPSPPESMPSSNTSITLPHMSFAVSAALRSQLKPLRKVNSACGAHAWLK